MHRISHCSSLTHITENNRETVNGKPQIRSTKEKLFSSMETTMNSAHNRKHGEITGKLGQHKTKSH